MDLGELKDIIKAFEKIDSVDDDTEIQAVRAKCEEPFEIVDEVAVGLQFSDGVPFIVIGPDFS